MIGLVALLAAASPPPNRLYFSFDVDITHVSASWPCPDYCSPSSLRVEFRATTPMAGIGVGYIFNRYVALEGSLHFWGSVSNDLSNTLTNYSANLDYGDVRLAVRADWPFARHWAAFARFGGVYQAADFGYSVGGSSFSTSMHGLTPQGSAGISWSNPSFSVRLSIDRRASVGTSSLSSWTLGVDMPVFN